MMLCLAFVAGITLFISSCKKSTSIDVPETVEPEPKAKFDSVYFEIEGKSYAGKPDIGGINSVGNMGYRMRYLEAPEEGMKIYQGYGDSKNGWYASTDSIYFTAGNSYETSRYESLHIDFCQGMPKSNMTEYGSFYFPTDTRKMFKKGKLGFATDFQNENFKNGVSISFENFGRTGKPEWSHGESPEGYTQDDSTFEIINTEQIDENSYFVEAKFELNLYDKERVKHRVTNGYLRFTLQSRGVFGYFFH